MNLQEANMPLQTMGSWKGRHLFSSGVDLNNTNSTDGYYDKLNISLTAVLPVFAIVFIACMVGNIVVISTVARDEKMRKKRWYYFLANLAIADMGFALMTPFHLLQFANVDIGVVGCKSSIYIIDIFMLTSISTLAYISIDRFICICRPSVGNSKTLHPKYIITILWLAAAIFFLPFPIFCRKSADSWKNSCDCHSAWPSRDHYTAYKFIIVVVGFYMPFITMIVCYSKICSKLWGKGGTASSIAKDRSGKKKRSVKMMILATTLFFVSWFPYTVLYLIKQLNLGDPGIVGKFWLFIQVIGFANSAWNPFVYCFFSKKFRQGFKSIFICCKKRAGKYKRNENKGAKEMKQKSMDSTGTRSTDDTENSRETCSTHL